MDWKEVKIYTSTEGIDPLCGSLLGIGIKGFQINDSNDFNEFLNDKNGKWDYIDESLMELSDCETSVTVYIPDNAQGAEMFQMLKSELKRLSDIDAENAFGRLEFETDSVKEEDWANNWKQYFKPLKIGNKLLIKPSWEEYNDTDGRKILEIDPASSFGTGQHNTTQLCLELLEDVVNDGDKLLDVGCGSGILSIGALLLGADKVTAVDIEQNAADISKENFEKNHMPKEKYDVYCGNILDDKKLFEMLGNGYDVITANIVADVLIAMRNLFVKLIRKGGTLIISGIIVERRNEVIDAIKSAGFTLIDLREGGGWAAVKFEMKD